MLRGRRSNWDHHDSNERAGKSSIHLSKEVLQTDSDQSRGCIRGPSYPKTTIRSKKRSRDNYLHPWPNDRHPDPKQRQNIQSEKSDNAGN